MDGIEGRMMMATTEKSKVGIKDLAKEFFATPAEEVPEVKKSASKKPAAKASAKTSKAVTAPKEIIKVQFGGEEYDFAEIKKAVEADYKGKVKGKITTVELYIKPEDKAVYYVINGDFSDKIEL
jgi:hypothetical protein